MIMLCDRSEVHCVRIGSALDIPGMEISVIQCVVEKPCWVGVAVDYTLVRTNT